MAICPNPMSARLITQAVSYLSEYLQALLEGTFSGCVVTMRGVEPGEGPQRLPALLSAHGRVQSRNNGCQPVALAPAASHLPIEPQCSRFSQRHRQPVFAPLAPVQRGRQ